MNRWWGLCFAAVLFFIAFLGRSGGGFGPGSVCGDLDSLYTLGTFIAVLAIPIFFVGAVVSTLARLIARNRPAGPDAPLPPHDDSASAAVSVGVAQSLAWRILPGALVLGGVGFILLGPSGCVPFRVCAQGNEIAQAPGPGVRFVGDLPLDAAGRLNEVYTTTFAAKDPWELRWRTTADLVRIDIFTAEAVQTGRYFPSAGHRFVSDTLANSSTIVNESGNFCVRIELRDTAFEAANRAYYSGPARPTGPPPTPRRMAWEVTVESR